MKVKKYIYGMVMGAITLASASCYNADKTFPDFEEGTTAFFAYQFPVRTLVLGDDIYDNSLDNEHKCRIWSTMGGAYGGRDADISIEVIDSLCDNLFFVDEGGNPAEPVLPMPKEYYSLGSNVISYNGDQRGYVEVQFTDAFFNDPKSVNNTYVIPLVMKSVSGIDRINTGSPREGLTPVRTNTEDWETLAKDYVLYCVKYMNPWQARYIRRGLDHIIDGGKELTVVRKDTTLVNSDLEHYTENPINQNDEVVTINTKNMLQAIFPVAVRTASTSITCNLLLTFDGNKCNITTEDADVVVKGTGEYISKGTDLPEYKDYQWGSIEGQPVSRNILRLAYDVEFTKKNIKVSTADTLVVQTREANKKVFFTPKYVKP